MHSLEHAAASSVAPCYPQQREIQANALEIFHSEPPETIYTATNDWKQPNKHFLCASTLLPQSKFSWLVEAQSSAGRGGLRDNCWTAGRGRDFTTHQFRASWHNSTIRFILCITKNTNYRGPALKQFLRGRCLQLACGTSVLYRGTCSLRSRKKHAQLLSFRKDKSCQSQGTASRL